MATHRMAPCTSELNKQRRLALPPSLSEDSTSIIYDPQRLAREKQRYSSVQARYIVWGKERNRDVLTSVSAVDLVNYLAFGHKSKRWTLATCTQYKQAILQLYSPEQRQMLVEHPYVQALFKGLKENCLLSYDFPDITLQPAIDFLLNLGENSTLAILDLTRKLCFLLGITGFMRPSDLDRVDDSRTVVSTAPLSLKLVVIGPKERRAGRPIEKVVLIRGHSNLHLCPVLCYQAYQRYFAQYPVVRKDHPTLSSISLQSLLRSTTQPQCAIGSERISKHIRFILDKAVVSPSHASHKTLKARAVGSTRAVLAGANLEDILTHGNWASSAIFDTFYRLNRATATDFTAVTL